MSYKGADQYIKIGMTIDVSSRLTNYRTGTPFDIQVNLVIPVRPFSKVKCLEMEDKIHQQFEPFLHRYEWYEYTTEIQEYIGTYDFTPFDFTEDMTAIDVDRLLSLR